MRKIIFCLELVFISLVSSIDLYLLLKYASVIDELNPVTLWSMNSYGVPATAGLKMFGTICANYFLIGLYLTPRMQKYALISAHIVSILALVLLWFLFYA